MDGVRPTGEDDDTGIQSSNCMKRRSTCDADREDRELANPASYEVGVLGTKVQDEDRLFATGGRNV